MGGITLGMRVKRPDDLFNVHWQHCPYVQIAKKLLARSKANTRVVNRSNETETALDTAQKMGHPDIGCILQVPSALVLKPLNTPARSRAKANCERHKARGPPPTRTHSPNSMKGPRHRKNTSTRKPLYKFIFQHLLSFSK